MPRLAFKMRKVYFLLKGHLLTKHSIEYEGIGHQSKRRLSDGN